MVCYVTNNHERLRRDGSSIVLYLPKIETAEEAALFNEMLTALERHLGLDVGTIKAYVLAVSQLARHYGRSPDSISRDEVRDYIHHLITDRKLVPEPHEIIRRFQPEMENLLYLAMMLPISAFVAAGFEHCVANMYFIPCALLIKDLDPEFTVSVAAGASRRRADPSGPATYLFSGYL